MAARTEMMEEEEETDASSLKTTGPPPSAFLPASLHRSISPTTVLFFLAAVENIYIHQMAREKKKATLLACFLPHLEQRV